MDIIWTFLHITASRHTVFTSLGVTLTPIMTTRITNKGLQSGALLMFFSQQVTDNT